jgi:hypothetical protein
MIEDQFYHQIEQAIDLIHFSSNERCTQSLDWL